jgi:hypothetical protein
MPHTLTIEIGKAYKTRSGKRVTIFGRGTTKKGTSKYFGRYDSGKELHYNSFGRNDMHMGYDLIGVWVE